MPVLLVAVLHAMISTGAAMAIAHYSSDPFAVINYLWPLCATSAACSATGFAATARYLSRRIGPKSGALVGVLCGLLCSAMLGLAVMGVEFTRIPYLTIFAPTLLAVLLASLLERPKSGWQT
jgi:hypothetical protein